MTGFQWIRSVVAVLSVLPLPATAETFVFSKDNNKVEWVALGTPGFLRINGTGASAEGTLSEDQGKISGILELALANYKTGIESRDEHMHKKYLETQVFPLAKLVLRDQIVDRNKEFKWGGQLTIKKDTNTVNGTALLEGKSLRVTFTIPMKDFPSIGVPKYLGITMADEVEVNLEGSF